jgi:hypothetical protein
VEELRGSVIRDLPVGTREQQRLEYLQLSEGHYLEVDATDGGGLIFESHLKD